MPVDPDLLDADAWIDEQEDESDAERNPRWKMALLGEKPARALKRVPSFQTRVFMSLSLAQVAKRVAEEDGLTLAYWTRKAVADALAERLAVDPKDIYERMSLMRVLGDE